MLTKQIPHQYPHQVSMEVEDENLRADFEANPEQYHEALHEHIKRYLGEEVLSKVASPETPQGVEEWVEFLRVNETATITTDQAVGFIEQGGADALDEFAGRINDPDAVTIVHALYANSNDVPPYGLIHEMQSVMPSDQIIRELVDYGDVGYAVDFASDFDVTEYDHESLFQAVLTEDNGATTLKAIDLFIEEGHGSVAFNAFLRDNNEKRLQQLLNIIDEFPSEIINTTALLNGSISHGKAFDLYKVINILPTNDGFEWKRLCDAVVYEGHGFNLLRGANVGYIDKSLINFNKILEQMQKNDILELELEMDQFIENANHTAIVQAMMRIGDIHSYGQYAEALKDADVDYDNLMDMCLKAYSTCPISIIKIGSEKLGADVFLDKLISNKSVVDIMSIAQFGAMAEVFGYGLVMDRILQEVQNLVDPDSVSKLWTILINYPSNEYDKTKIEDITIEYLASGGTYQIPYALQRANSIDVSRIYVEAFTLNPSSRLAAVIMNSDMLRSGLDIDYRQLVELFIIDNANDISVILHRSECFPLEVLPIEAIFANYKSDHFVEMFIRTYEDQIDPTDRRYRSLFYRLLSIDNINGGYLPQIVFEGLSPDEIVTAWRQTEEGREAILLYSEKLADAIDIWALLERMDKSELDNLYPDTVESLIKQFGAERVAEFAMERNLYVLLKDGADEFIRDITDRNTLARLLTYFADNNMYQAVLNNTEMYNEMAIDIDYTSMANDLIDNNVYSFLLRIHAFPEDSYSNDDIATALSKNQWLSSELMIFLKDHEVSNATHAEIILKLRTDSPREFINYTTAFPDKVTRQDLQIFYDQLYDNKNYELLLENSALFPEDMIDTEGIMDEVLSEEEFEYSPSYEMILSQLPNIKNVDPKYIDKIIDNMDNFNQERYSLVVREDLKRELMKVIAVNVESFKDYTRQEHTDRIVQDELWECVPEEWMKEVTIDFQKKGYLLADILDGDNQKLLRLYLLQESNRPVSAREETTSELLSLFGHESNIDQSRLVYEIHSGNVSEEMVALGIPNGKEGNRKLQNIVDTIRKQTFKGELSSESIRMIGDSSALRAEFARLTRYEVSQWGNHTSESFLNTIREVQQSEKSGLQIPLPDEYQPSEIYEIELLKSDTEAVVVTTDVKERYAILRSEIFAASDLLKKSRGFSDTIESIRTDVRSIANKIDKNIDSGKIDPKAERFQRKLVEELRHLVGDDNDKKYPLRSLKEIEQHFSSLAKHEELHPAMRKLIFAWALRKQPDWRDKVSELSEESSIDDISLMHDFIDQTVNDQTFRTYFTNKKTAQQFKRITSVKSLEGALDRNQGKGIAKDTTKLQIVPARGLMLELSGHIADACWADRYSSINEEMPNMSTLLFRQNPGAKDERLAGAALVIETRNPETDESVLLLRGVNPIENYINKVSAESFYTTATDYVRDLARKRGMKPAVVIDDHAGGSASNRPALYEYMAKQINKMTKVTVDNNTTKFNGYNVTQDSYAL